MKFIFVCGGTAGHVNPALAIAKEIGNRLPGSEILFIGADRELEKRLVPEAGFKLENIKMSGIKRGFKPSDLLYNAKTLKNTVAASFTAAKLIRGFKPDAVIGTGGYICYPVLKKAAQMRIPTFIHESNAHPGLTVKMLSPIVDKVLVAFDGFEDMYKKPERVIFTGTPLRREFYEAAGAPDVKQPKDKPLVVSFWGSLGAQRMNEMMVELIRLNAQSNRFRHIHATGANPAEMKKSLLDAGVTEIAPPMIDLREYINDMPAVMKAADVILCRAGGITTAELIALGKPCILVPSQYVPDNVQPTNAQQLSKAGGAIVISEKECSAKLLFDTLSFLLDDPDELGKMSNAQKSLSSSNATDKIIDIVLDYFRYDNYNALT